MHSVYAVLGVRACLVYLCVRLLDGCVCGAAKCALHALIPICKGCVSPAEIFIWFTFLPANPFEVGILLHCFFACMPVHVCKLCTCAYCMRTKPRRHGCVMP